MLTLFSIFKNSRKWDKATSNHAFIIAYVISILLINTCLQPELKLGYGVAAPGFEQFSGKDLLLCSPYNSIGMSIVISLVFIDLYLSNLRSFTKQGQQDDSFMTVQCHLKSTRNMPCTINKKGLYRSVRAYSFTSSCSLILAYW